MALLPANPARKERVSSLLSKSKPSHLEVLMASFNENPDNSKVIDYISAPNLFDVIGKSRHEMVHSRMLADLLSGRYFVLSKKMSLVHFLDILEARSRQQGIEIPHEVRESILTRSLNIDAVLDAQTELPIYTYLREPGKSDLRLDVYLKYSLSETLKYHGRKCIEFFIENKVLAKEHDKQTQSYFDFVSNGKSAIQFFVYLSPISQRDLAEYDTVPEEMKPCAVDKEGRKVYVHISYQDILDKVIEPLLADSGLSDRDRILLNEYANCLELPALPDDEDQKLGAKDLSIMAVSTYESELLTKFSSNADNSRLLEIAVNYHLGKQLYSYDGEDCLSFDQALQKALLHYTDKHGVLKSMKDFKDVFGTQHNGARFLISSVKETSDSLFYIPTHLFEYDGKAYPGISEALQEAIKDYIARKGKKSMDVIEDFKPIYSRVQNHPHVFRDTPFEQELGFSYVPTVFPNLFIRSQIDNDKLKGINDILGPGFSITTITSECYHQLLHQGIESLLHCYEKRLFCSLPGTDYWYRKGADDRLDKINQILETKITPYKLSESEKRMLSGFYKNNRKLILSVYRILLEKEAHRETFEQRKREYGRLLKTN